MGWDVAEVEVDAESADGEDDGGMGNDAARYTSAGWLVAWCSATLRSV